MKQPKADRNAPGVAVARVSYPAKAPAKASVSDHPETLARVESKLDQVLSRRSAFAYPNAAPILPEER